MEPISPCSMKTALSSHHHVGSPSSRELMLQYMNSDLGGDLLGAMECLEADGSLLGGMLRSFLKECGVQRVQLQQQQPPKQHQQQKRQRETEMTLKVTLEELFLGCVKHVTVPRRRHDALTGSGMSYQECLQVRVQPGLKEGTRITLPGHEQDGSSADLTFIVQQQLHPSFRRLADDLYAIVNVPLRTALTGGPVSMRTLSGQVLQLPTGDTVITPGSELVVPDQGMPVLGAAGRRGALHVRFNVCFPQHLSSQQQQQLRSALAGCEFTATPQLSKGPRVPVLQQSHHQQHTPVVQVMEVTEEAAPEQQQQQYRQHKVAGMGTNMHNSCSIAGFPCGSSSSTGSTGGSNVNNLHSFAAAAAASRTGLNRTFVPLQQQQQQQ